MWRGFLASMLLVGVVSTQADAGLLQVNYSGLVAEGGTWDGVDITPGTSFNVHAIFETPGVELIDTGVALYLVDSIYGDVGGTAFTVNLVPGQYFLELVDPSAVPFGLPAYVPVLVEFGGDTTIAPFYLTATPELTADAPVPTEFSDYFGLFIGAVLFSTDSGDLIFFADDADPNFATSITAVPEPSTLTIACLGSLAGLLAFRRARRTQVAA